MAAAKKTTSTKAAAPKAAAKEKEVKSVELVSENEVPAGALEDNPDGSVNTYDADGNKAGNVDAETAEKLQEEAGQQLEQQTETEEAKENELVKVKVIKRYLDKKLNQIKDKGETLQVTEDRAAELEKAGVAQVSK